MSNLRKRSLAVIARKEWLEQANLDLGPFLDDVEALEAFSSQEKFAAYSSDTVMGMSLNALKRQADKHLTGGFPALEQLRKSVYSRLIQKRGSKLQPLRQYTTRELKNSNKDLRSRVSDLQGELLLASLCLKEALDGQRELAYRFCDNKEIELYKKRRREILALFVHGVRTDVALAAFDNVVTLKDAKKT